MASALTLGNAGFGFGALMLAAQARGREASICILVGALLDGLDGPLARWSGTASQLGAELDSLADCVTFVVAPAFLAWTQRTDPWLPLAAGAYVLAGVYRLARINATPRRRSFEGMPTPLAAALALCLPSSSPILATLAALMVSRLPFPKLKISGFWLSKDK